jgi:hypothetical protein
LHEQNSDHCKNLTTENAQNKPCLILHFPPIVEAEALASGGMVGAYPAPHGKDQPLQAC